MVVRLTCRSVDDDDDGRIERGDRLPCEIRAGLERELGTDRRSAARWPDSSL